ncbi:MAG: hypothetical protein IH840_00550 [Candidatus Heimdallarchaeota archaeon]|nr:hypothetical protein [Candidatus Heimdallarchaeota archaeon]
MILIIGFGFSTGLLAITPSSGLITLDSAPHVLTADQPIVDDNVTIAEVFSTGPGWLVIHNDSSGSFDEIAGLTWVADGLNNDVEVKLNATGRTTTMHAMLHRDVGTIGTYDGSEDTPVFIGSILLNVPFTITDTLVSSVTVMDQNSVSDVVTIDEAVSSGPGWLVIHNSTGSVVGWTGLSHGINKYVEVTLVELTPSVSGDAMNAMLHTDDGTVGTYEFGDGSGNDGPVKNSTGVIINPAFTFLGDLDPSVSVMDQAVVDDVVTIYKAVSEGPGWLVVHNSTGGVIGNTWLSHGMNKYVEVTLSSPRTSSVSAMLHTDNGALGTYEFGDGSGNDGPVSDLNLATPAIINPAFDVTATLVSSVTVLNQTIVGNTVIIKEVVSKGPGWLVVHADSGTGSPSTVLGWTWLMHGVNSHVAVTLQSDNRTDILFAMLHTDTGNITVYEFPGVDSPVKDSAGATITPWFNVAPTTISVSVTVTEAGTTGTTTVTEVETVTTTEAGTASTVTTTTTSTESPFPTWTFVILLSFVGISYRFFRRKSLR